jgi:small conductance mechanosensitive channel
MPRVFGQAVRGIPALIVLASGAAVAAETGPAVTGGKGAESGTLTGFAQQLVITVGEAVATYGLKIVGAVLILLVGRWVAKLLSAVVAKALAKVKLDPTLVPFIENLTYTALLIFVVIAALARVGVETASLIAVLGAAGLAVGLALQGSLANFASGVLILVFKPFRLGDFVEVAGVKGTVQAIQVFNTVLNAPDNVRIVVPNGQVTGGCILNYTINGTRRVELVASVSYDDDLKTARRAIESVLAAEPRILPTPAPVVAVGEMADSSVDFIVRPWVKVEDYWPVYWALTEKLKEGLEAHGLNIPFPQQEITIKTDAAAMLKSV